MRLLYFFLVLIFGIGGLQAQVSPHTEKFFLNFELQGSRIFFDEDNFEKNDGGGGLGLRVGYGFTPTFAAYIGFTGANANGENNGIINDNYTLGIGELGARLHFGKKIKSPVFYLDLSFQGIEATYDEDFELSFKGAGIGVGGGLLVYTSEKLAIDFGLRTTLGSFTDVTFNRVTFPLDDDSFGFVVNRLSVGISWFPSRR